MTTSTPPLSPEDMQKAFEDYVAKMQKQLAAAQTFLDDLANAEAAKQIDYAQEKSILQDFYNTTDISNISNPTAKFQHDVTKYEAGQDWYSFIKPDFVGRYTYHKATDYMAAKHDIDAQNSKVQSDMDNLKAIDPNLSSSNILASLASIGDAGSKQLANVSAADLGTAMTQLKSVIDQFKAVVLNAIQADLALSGMKEMSDGNNSLATTQLASIAIQSQMQEQTGLVTIQGQVIDNAVDWQKEKSDAEADLQTSHWYDDLVSALSLGFANIGPDKAKDHAAVDSANAMLAFIDTLQTTIGKLLITVDPGTEVLRSELDKVQKKLQDFLDGKGSLLDLKNALIEAFSILAVIITEKQKKSSEMDTTMSKGNQASMQMHQNDSLDQTKVIEDAQEYAKTMGILLDVAKYVGMALIFLLDPGAGTACMLAIDIALNASGVMDKLQNAIADKLGGTAGAILTSLVEAVGTAGGAAAIEAAVSKLVVEVAAKTVAKTMTEATETLVKGTVESAVKAAGKEAVEGGKEAAETVVRQILEATTKAAEKKLTDAFLSKTVPQMVQSMVKKELEKTIETVVKDALETAATKAAPLAEGAVKGVQSATGTAVGNIAKSSATEAAQKGLDISAKSAEKLGTKSDLSKALMRGGFTGIGAIGQTDLLSNMTADIEKKDKKDLDDRLQYTFMALNAISQFISGFGTAGGMEMLSNPNLMTKIAVAANAANGAVTGVGNVGMYNSTTEKATCVEKVGKDQAALQSTNLLAEKEKKDGNAHREAYLQQIQQTLKTALHYAMHASDAYEAATAV